MISDILLLLVYSLRTSVSSTGFMTSRARATSGPIVPSTVPCAGWVPNTWLIPRAGERVFSMQPSTASLDQHSGQLGQQPSSTTPTTAFFKRLSLDGSIPAAIPSQWKLSAMCRENSWGWKLLYSISACRLWKTSPPKLTQRLLWQVPELIKCMGDNLFWGLPAPGRQHTLLLKNGSKYSQITALGCPWCLTLEPWTSNRRKEVKVVGPSHPLSVLWPPSPAILSGPQSLGLKCLMAEQLL